MTLTDRLGWPYQRLGEALERLALSSRLARTPCEIPPPPAMNSWEADLFARWLTQSAALLELEAEMVECTHADLPTTLRGIGPALVWVPRSGDDRLLFFAILRRRGRRELELLGPDLRVVRLPLEEVRAEIARPFEEPLRVQLGRVLDQVELASTQRDRALHTLLAHRLGPANLFRFVPLRLAPGGNLLHQLRQMRLIGRFGAFLAAHVLQYLLLLGAWWMVGRGALEGRFDPGWLTAWALTMLSLVPVRLMAAWWQGVFGMGLVGVLKRRMLFGALQLEPDEIRLDGAGKQLARVVESQQLAGLTLDAGFSTLAAILDLGMAAVVLGLGAGGPTGILLLLGWTLLTLLIGWRYYRQRRQWTQLRVDMTHEVVERMVGHRTRLAQERPDRWHDGEDQALEHYLDLSEKMDWSTIQLTVMLSRGWLIVGLGGLIPTFLAGDSSMGLLAVGIGGVLLARQAFGTLAGSLSQITQAAIAWTQARPLFMAALRRMAEGVPGLGLSPITSPPPEQPTKATDEELLPDGISQPPVEHTTAHSAAADPQQGSRLTLAKSTVTPPASLLDVRELYYRYRDRGAPVLQGCSLRITPGDRLLLEGPSGGGKSTLISVISGLRRPESGLLLLGGFDLGTLGPLGWRKRIAVAPQFHENHVLTNTMAFNLLMGRRWPPQETDIQEALELCSELGLGPLVERMPGGLQQVVGESGWQLSHGERSRLFLARALLQRADLVLLDESFGALDPETMGQALTCALNRARTLLVIAHP